MTERFFGYLEQRKTLIREMWAEAAWGGELKPEELAAARAHVDLIDVILDMNEKDFNEYEE